MRHPRSIARFGAVALGLCWISAAAALAQLQTGNLYGKVHDENNVPLPGVTVTLDTGEAPQVQVTNAQGEFRFLNLAPATYKIKAELDRYSPVEYPRIVVAVGRNTDVDLIMNAAFKDTVTITEESSGLDMRQPRAGADFNHVELQKIPTARDPWTILQTTPGVLMDRVNVGGSQSGQQSFYTGPGSFSTQSVWSVDGVVITDMSALGGTPAYYDFDSFEEMQISTGGPDSSIATGGVVLNLVTRRGTNELRGSARYLQVPGSTESSTSLKTSDIPAAQRSSFLGGSNKINKIEDYGVEAGGPILKDHLWLWGAYGVQNVSVQTLPKRATPNGITDKTKLPTLNGKVNAQLTAGNSATLVGFNNDKQKTGRNAGPTRPQETTWIQGQYGGKPSLLKAEDTQIFNPNLYLTLLYSHVYGGFFLDPQSGIGPNVPEAFQDATATWHNSFLDLQDKRPQHQEKADSFAYFRTGDVSHELKFGAAYRVATTVSSANWQGGGYIQSPALLPPGSVPPGMNLVNLTRPELAGVKTKYASGYVQDTLSAGALVANLGLRYDRQGGDNLPETVAANPLVPDRLPAVSYPGGPIGFTWKTWAPRLGLTYALGRDRSTLLRASYSRFADQLGQDTNHAQFLNPLAAISYYYAGTSNPGDGHVTPGQVFPIGAGYSSNVNPANGQLVVANAVSRSLNAPITDELLVSAEHALLPEFVVGLNLAYRLQRHLLQEDLLVFDANGPDGPVGRLATRDDFVPQTATATLPNGRQVPVTWYALRPGVTTNHGYLLRNGDYQTTFKGASLTFHKRLSHGWMLRGNLSYNDWTYGKAGDRPDPTALIAGGLTDGNYVRQGDLVLQGSGPASGAFQNVYINSKWSFAVNGMVQVAKDRPWGFNVAGNLTGRQGYPDPYWVPVNPANTSVPNPFAGGETVQIGSANSNRLDNIIDFDLRLEKELTFQGFGLTLGVDCFNLFNQAFILQRQGQFQLQHGGVITPVNAGFINEVLSPRIFRFGARLSFK
jgi:Carboxypeptidase regulatory-like domain